MPAQTYKAYCPRWELEPYRKRVKAEAAR
ncbi:hypothetical protein LCGC14_2852940, partial [marine sediment metagenome]